MDVRGISVDFEDLELIVLQLQSTKSPHQDIAIFSDNVERNSVPLGGVEGGGVVRCSA